MGNEVIFEKFVFNFFCCLMFSIVYSLQHMLRDCYIKAIMDDSFFFFVESKSFEFCVEEGGSFFSLRIFERGRYSLRSVFMGKECAKRLLSMLGRLCLH